MHPVRCPRQASRRDAIVCSLTLSLFDICALGLYLVSVMPSEADAALPDASSCLRSFGCAGCGSFGGVGFCRTRGRVSGYWDFCVGWLHARCIERPVRIILLILCLAIVALAFSSGSCAGYLFEGIRVPRATRSIQASFGGALED